MEIPLFIGLGFPTNVCFLFEVWLTSASVGIDVDIFKGKATVGCGTYSNNCHPESGSISVISMFYLITTYFYYNSVNVFQVQV